MLWESYEADNEADLLSLRVKCMDGVVGQVSTWSLARSIVASGCAHSAIGRFAVGRRKGEYVWVTGFEELRSFNDKTDAASDDPKGIGIVDSDHEAIHNVVGKGFKPADKDLKLSPSSSSSASGREDNDSDSDNYALSGDEEPCGDASDEDIANPVVAHAHPGVEIIRKSRTGERYRSLVVRSANSLCGGTGFRLSAFPCPRMQDWCI